MDKNMTRSLYRTSEVAKALGIKAESVYRALARSAGSVPKPDYERCPTCGARGRLWKELP